MDEKASLPTWMRYPVMLCGGIGLLAALLGGMTRLGVPLLELPGRIPLQHGGLMVSGFLGIVIAMERAVSVPIRGALGVPAIGAAGTLMLVLTPYHSTAILLIVLSSIGVLGLFGYIFSVQPSLHNFVLLVAGTCWIVGNVFWWWGVPVHVFVGWWMGFLIFVIAAERLELNRLVRFGFFQKSMFITGVVLGLAGLAIVWANQSLGPRLYSLGFIVLAVWLIQNDMIRKMLFMEGERGYTGWCLFTGYLWLGAGGVLRILYPTARSGFLYDGILHAVFVGFVFTMIFGHAFIIMPGVLNVNLTFHRWFYGPLVLLEGGLVLRVAGDLLFHTMSRRVGASLNALAIVLFLLMLAETAINPRGESDASEVSG